MASAQADVRYGEQEVATSFWQRSPWQASAAQIPEALHRTACVSTDHMKLAAYSRQRPAGVLGDEEEVGSLVEDRPRWEPAFGELSLRPRGEGCTVISVFVCRCWGEVGDGQWATGGGAARVMLGSEEKNR